jgi:hypothetical protein
MRYYFHVPRLQAQRAHKKKCELQKVTAYPIESSRKGGAKPKKIDVRRDRTLGGEKRGSTIATPAKELHVKNNKTKNLTSSNEQLSRM